MGEARRRAAGLPLLVALALGLAVWWGAAGLLRARRVVPYPIEVARQMVTDRASYLVNGAVTLREAAVGFLWGNAAAVMLGILFVQFPRVERSLLRVAIATYCIPLVTIGPILVVVLPGDGPKEALAALAVFFTTLLGTLQGLRSANPSSLEVVASLGGSPTRAFWTVRIPSALPALLAALRIAAPAALLGAVIGEYFGASQGLGVALVQAQSAFEVARSWGIAAVLALLASLLYLLVSLAAHTLAPWAGSEVSPAVGFSGGGDPGPPFTRLLRATAYLIVSLTVSVGLWYLLLRAFRLGDYFAKTPLDVFRYLAAGPGAGGNRAELAAALRITIIDAGIGYAGGTWAAVLAALALAAWPPLELALLPGALVLRSIPIVAIAPLVALVCGRGLLGVTVVVSSVVFFPTLVFVLTALRDSPRAAGEVVTALGGSPLMVAAKVRFWYSLPALFTSARAAVPAALGGAVLVEWLSTGQGAGNLLVVSYSESQFDTLWAGSVVLIALSLAGYAALGAAETAVARRLGKAGPGASSGRPLAGLHHQRGVE